MPYKCNGCNKSFRYKVSQKSHKCLINDTESIKNIENNHSGKEIVAKLLTETPNKNTGTTSPSLPHVKSMVEAIVQKTEKAQKTSILLSFNPHIEITYNASDLESATENNIVTENVPNEELLTSDVPGN